ncbi:alpha/beta hydrolase [Williamsia sp. CHRR-6]|nr:alpha/beta hydrolase [Williamsia sp. CHRR-6]
MSEQPFNPVAHADGAPPTPGRLVSLNGLDIHVVVQGAGPPVLLLASLGGHWFDLDHLANALADRFQVIRYDRPGYGLSSPLARHHHPTLAAEIERIGAVLDAAGVTGPVLIAAHSMSSMYAEGFARTAPDRVAALLMIDGSFVMAPWRVLPTAVRVRNAHRAARAVRATGLLPLVGPRLRHLALPTPPGGFDPVQRQWISRVFSRSVHIAATMVENAAFPAINLDLIRVRRRHRLDVPVTVLAALPVQGWWYRRAWRWRQRRYARHLDAVYEQLSPTNHLLVTEHPEPVAHAIERLARRSGFMRPS